MDQEEFKQKEIDNEKIDIPKLNECISRAIVVSNQLAGKDIGLILGETGAGKTTTVNFLVG